MSVPRKRRAFAIKEKVNVFQESLQPGYSQAKAAKKHGISISTLSKILWSKESILSNAH